MRPRTNMMMIIRTSKVVKTPTPMNMMDSFCGVR